MRYTALLRRVSALRGQPAPGPDPDPPAPVAPTNLRATSVTSSQVVLAVDDTNDGQYGYEWYRGGILLDITAAGGASFSDNTVQPEQSYTYEVRTVGMSSGPTLTVNTPQETEPGEYLFGPGPNEPAGLHPFLAWSPAEHGVDMAAALGSDYSGGAIGMGWGWGDHMTVVADAAVPGGAAMRQDWPIGTTTRAGNASWNWTGHTPDPSLYPGWSGPLGPLREVYGRFMVYIPNSWERNPGNAKFIGFVMEDGTSDNLDSYLQHRNNDHSWRFQCQENGGPDNREWRATAGDTSPFQYGQWYDVEFHLVAQSIPGAADGGMYVWRNNVKATAWQPLGGGRITDGSDMQVLTANAPGTRYRGINVWPYYFGGSTYAKTRNDYLLWGGLYLSGR